MKSVAGVEAEAAPFLWNHNAPITNPDVEHKKDIKMHNFMMDSFLRKIFESYLRKGPNFGHL
jgi:hypothetical protein